MSWLISAAFKPLFNYISGLIFALQFFSFFAFCFYCLNEFFVITKGRSFVQELKKKMFKLLLEKGFIKLVENTSNNEPLTKVNNTIQIANFNLYNLEYLEKAQRTSSQSNFTEKFI